MKRLSFNRQKQETMLKFGISDQWYADLTYMQLVALECKICKRGWGDHKTSLKGLTPRTYEHKCPRDTEEENE